MLQRYTMTTDYFDITELLVFLNTTSIVTGIQRVQVEAILARAGECDAERPFKCIVFGPDQIWRTLPDGVFEHLINTAEQGIADWPAWFARFSAALPVTEPEVFSVGDLIYFLGTTWHIGGLYESLCGLSRDGVKCIFYLHDVIAIKHPEYVLQTFETTFSYNLYAISKVADAIICNSEATKRDFLDVSGYDRPMKVVNLAIQPQFASPIPAKHHLAILSRYELERHNFVLMVGTVEPRKNHIAVANVWNDLSKRFGDACPPLVIVGRVGWNAEGICQHLGLMNRSDKIVHLKNLEDNELSHLYQNCMFTVYASRYEGWGLPVTESLAFGKLCVCPSNSSLGEASQGLAIHFDERSERELLNTITRLIEQPHMVSEYHQKISSKATFKTWQTFVREIQAVAKALPCRHDGFAPEITPESTYRFGRGGQPNAFTGEMPGEFLLSGQGWCFAEEKINWSTGPKSGLTFRPSRAGNFDCYIYVVAPPDGTFLQLFSRDELLWDGSIRGQKLVCGHLGNLTAGEMVQLHITSDQQIKRPTNATNRGNPATGIGLIALQIRDRNNDSKRTDNVPVTLEVLKSICPPR